MTRNTPQKYSLLEHDTAVMKALALKARREEKQLSVSSPSRSTPTRTKSHSRDTSNSNSNSSTPKSDPSTPRKTPATSKKSKASNTKDAIETLSKETPKTHTFEYEFGGPIGALATTLLLPIVVMLLAHWSDVGYVDLSFLSNQATEQSMNMNARENIAPVTLGYILCPTCQSKPFVLLYCAIAMIAWFLFQVVLERFLPCELVPGLPVHGNKKHVLLYRINGHLAFWVTLLVTQVGYPYYNSTHNIIQFKSFPIHLLYDYFAPLALATILLCFGLNTWLYLDSFRRNKILAHGGNSGNHFYDFFIGRELNPRVGLTFDWKEFCELRPGLILWVLLNIACLQKQHMILGYVSGSMMMVCVFQGIYVWDALYQERAILTTMDITTDGFGFMLLFGDLAWVPFTYCLQAKYLVQHDPSLSAVSLAVILGLHVIGYLIFRGANSQKDAFRRDPNDPSLSYLTYLQTKRGTKLLTSGWWGMARKINYLGDYIMGVTWCLVCGFDSIVPYFYAVYFMILLIHRSIRDDHLCQEKYGDDWDKYKEMVPYRFIPGII